jgi:hypothetical protein
MKKIILRAVFVFSLVLNVAVAATLAWYTWIKPQPIISMTVPPNSSLTPSDVEHIRKVGLRYGSEGMMETRRRILEKNSQILDLIAKNPGNPDVADKAIKDLIGLKWIEEKKAVDRISSVLASMPENRREQFLLFMRRRTCMGPGMGMGRGMGMGHGRGGHMGGGMMRGPRWMRPE